MMVTLTLAIFAFAGQQGLDQKVTFTSSAKLVKPMLVELSKKTGVPLLTAQAIENRVLVIRVDDVPLKDLMDRIGDVTFGDWKQEQAGYRLVPSAEKRQKAEDAETERRTALFAKAIE